MRRNAAVLVLGLGACSSTFDGNSTEQQVADPAPKLSISSVAFSNIAAFASPTYCGQGVFPACASSPATQVRWGVSADPSGQRSGLGFGISPAQPHTISYGISVAVGTLTHFNWPTNSGTSAPNADLGFQVQVESSIAPGSLIIDNPATIHLAIDETPNSGPCVYSPVVTPCPDKLTIANPVFSLPPSTLDGTVYDLRFGFVDPADPTMSKTFLISQEGGTSDAVLVATLSEHCEIDTDGDLICDETDNCDSAANTDQADGDGDGVGDACDACPLDPQNDADGDGVCGNVDNCPGAANSDQADSDGDGIGDACDACPNDAANDADHDGVCGNVDNCVTTPNPDQADTDGDGAGNACDACPADPLNDADHDGVCGNVDNCPVVANPGQENSDGDANGNACDSCPLDPANDADGDGLCANVDNCPTVANPGQADADHDGIGDACDNDDDNDGVPDPTDQCPGTTSGPVDQAGCSVDQLCPCAGPWPNHGQYVSCVAQETQHFVSQGVLTPQQRSVLVSTAGQSNCGK